MSRMAARRRSPDSKVSPEHRFGGAWTEQKLDVLEKYLVAYRTALKHQTFKTAYIDAFAGTGYRSEREDEACGTDLLFADLAAAEPQSMLEGSVARALRVSPPFDTYIFIEKDPERAAGLEALKHQHSGLQVDVRQGDANAVIRELCARNWTRHRAVLFLDPYGMQVERSTIEAVARTQAIDMWLLFPLGIGVTRLLPNSGKLPAGWRRRLDLLLGTTTWSDELYRIEKVPTLFGDETEIVKKASNDVIGRYFVDRLKTAFPGVADLPLVLTNSTGCPLYLFCFAAANPAGAKIALKIANHILKKA
jgi:three-Cys-motif partner protein